MAIPLIAMFLFANSAIWMLMYNLESYLLKSLTVLGKKIFVYGTIGITLWFLMH